MKRQYTKYVYYQGQYWRFEGLIDYQGKVSLVRIFDSSQGINADPAKVRNAPQNQIEAIEKILEKEFTL